MENSTNVNLFNLSDSQVKGLALEVFAHAFKRDKKLGIDLIIAIKDMKQEFLQIDTDEIIEAERKMIEEKRKKKAKEEADAIAAKQAETWQIKKEQSQKLVDCLGYEKLYVTVWSKDSAGDVDRRVYVKTGDFYGGSDVATYWLHGNSKVIPKSLGTDNNRNISNNYDKNELKAIMHEIASSWKGVKFETAQAISYEA